MLVCERKQWAQSRQLGSQLQETDADGPYNSIYISVPSGQIGHCVELIKNLKAKVYEFGCGVKLLYLILPQAVLLHAGSDVATVFMSRPVRTKTCLVFLPSGSFFS